VQHSDPDYAKRTWRLVMEKMDEMKSGSTRRRWDTAVKDHAFDPFRSLALIQTQSEHFLQALHQGTVSTNVYLRRIHNFAFDMDRIAKDLVSVKPHSRPMSTIGNLSICHLRLHREFANSSDSRLR
jgi:hypothetical protein